MFGIVSSVDGPEIITDIVISLAGYAISRWPDWYGDRLFFQMWVRKDSVQINHCHSSKKYAKFIHRHRALPTITRIDQGGIAIQTKITAACAFISSSRFRPSLTGLVPGRSAEPRLRSHGVCKSISCWVTRQPPVSRNLLNRWSVILRMVTRRCGQNSYGTRKCNIYAKSCNERDPSMYFKNNNLKSH